MNRLNVGTALTVLFLALVASPGWAASQRTRELLVVEKGNAERLAIIDPVRLKVLARIPAGNDPHEVIASSDGTRAYVSNYGGSGSKPPHHHGGQSAHAKGVAADRRQSAALDAWIGLRGRGALFHRGDQ